MPAVNRNTFLHIFGLLRRALLDEESLTSSRMSPTAFAVVFSPSVMLNPTLSPEQAVINTKFETVFVESLLNDIGHLGDI
ncbi:MAG: hypothetical protein MHM6MM_004220 [Cercozoa sp. M6MM]